MCSLNLASAIFVDCVCAESCKVCGIMFVCVVDCLCRVLHCLVCCLCVVVLRVWVVASVWYVVC